MGVRLDPSDEYMHELGPESNFNESMYINCFDPVHRVGGWFRIGNRANEGYAEMTVCLYLPDGKVGFMFKRPNIDNNDAFDAGGLTWTMVKPFEELRIDYVGKVVVLDEPLQMANPKEAFTNNPYAECEVHITFTGQGKPSMFGGEPDVAHEAPGEEFAKGHYEQLIEARGSIRVAKASGTLRVADCATTHGDRGFGRPRGITAGSPPTSAAISASWRAALPKRTVRAHAEVSCGKRARCITAMTSKSVLSSRVTTRTTSASRAC